MIIQVPLRLSQLACFLLGVVVASAVQVPSNAQGGKVQGGFTSERVTHIERLCLALYLQAPWIDKSKPLPEMEYKSKPLDPKESPAMWGFGGTPSNGR